MYNDYTKMIHNCLMSNPQLADLVHGIYDFIPISSQYPYIYIETEFVDTHDYSGLKTFECSNKISIYDQSNSETICIAISNIVRETIQKIDEYSAVLKNSSNHNRQQNNIESRNFIVLCKPRISSINISSEQDNDGYYWIAEMSCITSGQIII